MLLVLSMTPAVASFWTSWLYLTNKQPFVLRRPTYFMQHTRNWHGWKLENGFSNEVFKKKSHNATGPLEYAVHGKYWLNVGILIWMLRWIHVYVWRWNSIATVQHGTSFGNNHIPTSYWSSLTTLYTSLSQTLEWNMFLTCC